jgi:hypothetical protein
VFSLVRYTDDGSVDPGFGFGGKVTAGLSDASASALVLQPDDKLVVGGGGQASGGAYSIDVVAARYEGGACAPTPDADGDGVGDACDPCPPGTPVQRPRLRLRRLLAPTCDDTLVWLGELTVPLSPPVDPQARGLRLVLAEATGRVLVDAVLPQVGYVRAVGFGWTRNAAGTRFVYRNRSDTRSPAPGVDAVKRVRIKVTPAGLVTFKVNAKGDNYAVTPLSLPLKATLVLDAPRGQYGHCGEVLMPGPSLAQGCDFNTDGNRLRCR